MFSILSFFKSFLYSDENICCPLRKLPTAIFSLVSDYLEPYDYLRLMNSSRSLFKDIKFETILHTYKISMVSGGLSTADMDVHFQKFDKVRRKFDTFARQRQLKLVLMAIPEQPLLKYASYFTKIYDINVHFSGTVSANFDFTIFDNISKVWLHGFHGIQKISNGFENIRQLTIMNFKDLISIHCPLMNLDVLHVHNCGNLVSFHHLSNVKSITISYCEKLQIDLSTTKDSLQRLFYTEIPSIFSIDTIPFHSMQYLSLTGLTRVDENALQAISRIPHVDLSMMGQYIPEFPLFYGKNLSLYGFSLLLWVESLETLQELSLSCCKNCKKLPKLPKLRKLQLTMMSDIEYISSESLPNCVNLTVTTCRRFRRINRLPRLRIVEIKNCPKFAEFFDYWTDRTDTKLRLIPTKQRKKINFEAVKNCNQIPLRTIQLGSLENFHNMASLRNFAVVILDSCRNIKNFDGFDQSDVPRSSRKVIIRDFYFGKCDVSGLGNIGTLELHNVHNLNNNSGIHHVDVLLRR